METRRFFIIVPFLNFGASTKRVEDFKAFLDKLSQQTDGATILVVECVLEGIPFGVTNATNPLHIRLTTPSPIYLKQNLINVGVSKLPSDWKYVAWIDEGAEFLDPQWLRKTVQALKKHKVVQLFDRLYLTNKEGKMEYEVPGFAKRYLQKTLARPDKLAVNNAGESSATSNCARSFADSRMWKSVGEIDGEYGLGWATSRKTWEMLDGLLDIAIGGGGDVYMAYSFVGQLKKCGLSVTSEPYHLQLQSWAARAAELIQKNIGYVKGIAQRPRSADDSDDFFVNGEKILSESTYDPNRDLKRDLQGLYMYADPQSALAVKLTEYINKSKTI